MQAELCLKRTYVKASFMFVTVFLDIYENHRRKNLYSPSCPKYSEVIIFLTNFYTSWWCLKKVSSYQGTTKKC